MRIYAICWKDKSGIGYIVHGLTIQNATALKNALDSSDTVAVGSVEVYRA